MRRVLLVTGCPRSGTTAVGRNLALAPGTAALYEPFNYHSGDAAIGRYFEIPDTAAMSLADFDSLIARLRSLSLDLKAGIFPHDRGLRRLVKSLVGGQSKTSYYRCKLTPGLQTIVWKDPLAVFAVRASAQRHGIPALVTVRDPVAVAASFKRMGWTFDIPGIAARLREVREPLPAVVQEPQRLDDPVVNATILWELVYTTLLRWSREVSKLRFVDVEDIVRDPLTTYHELYATLQLTWTAGVERRIAAAYASVTADQDRALPHRAHVRRRDLSRLNVYGRELLQRHEIEWITATTAATRNRLLEQLRPGAGAHWGRERDSVVR